MFLTHIEILSITRLRNSSGHLHTFDKVPAGT
jgi:hypothetical protein